MLTSRCLLSSKLIFLNKKRFILRFMDLHEGSTSKRQRLDDNIPGAFGCPRHMSSFFCHPFAKSAEEFSDEKDKTTACASGNVLHTLSNSFKRWEGVGTKVKDEIMGKAVAYQTVIHPSLPNGLRSATARVLGITAAAVKFGVDARGNKSNGDMNEELRKHAFAKRRVRGDKNIVYHYFHHEGVLPDFCSLVEPDKNVRVKWKRKAWLFDGHERKLQCDMKIRKGTKGELAEDFLNSETHARYIVLFIIFLNILPLLINVSDTCRSTRRTQFHLHKCSSVYARAFVPI
jgi:hypothetical protein